MKHFTFKGIFQNKYKLNLITTEFRILLTELNLFLTQKYSYDIKSRTMSQKGLQLLYILSFFFTAFVI